MKFLIVFFLFWLFIVVGIAFADQPPFHEVAPGTQENFDVIYNRVTSLNNSLTAFINGAYVDVHSFGAKCDGSDNDTDAINNAISAANTSGQSLFFRPGTCVVTPGGLSDIKTSVLAADTFFQAASATDSWLMSVNFDTARIPAANSSPTGYTVDVGGFVGSSSFSGAGTGLYVKQSYRNYFIVHQTNWLKYGVHVDTTWHTGAPMPPIYENYFWIKADSGGVGLQITTNNDGAGVPIDSNYFYLGLSFNNTTAQLRITAGTNSGFSDVHNNFFEFEQLEPGQANSNGIVLTGICQDNTFHIMNHRGVNGTGKYFVAVDTNVAANRWDVDRDSFDVTKATFSLVATQELEIGPRRSKMFGMTTTAGVAAGSVNYFPAQGAALNATYNNVAMPVSSFGYARNFRVRTNTAPGVGETFTFKLVKNGSLILTLVISGAVATSASNLVEGFSFAGGDSVGWEITSSGGAAANTICFASFDFM